MSIARLAASVAAALLALSGSAAAQVLPPAFQLPGAVEPGRQELSRPTVEPPPIDLEWSIDLPGGAEAPARLADERLQLADLRLEGVTAYRPEDLLPLYQSLRGQDITVAALFGIARSLQARYHADGYLLSFAYLPPQVVEDGVFTVIVVEGFVDRVVIEDIEGPLRDRLDAVLAPIAGERPLRRQTLEGRLLQANELAGLTVTGVLQPSAGVRGASDLYVKADYRPVDGFVDLDNRGTRAVGPWRATAGVAANSWLDTGERLAFTAGTTGQTRESRSLAATWVQPIGPEDLALTRFGGLTVTGSASYATGRPGGDLAALDVKTRSLGLGLSVSQPIIRTRDESLSWTVGLSSLDSAADALGDPLTRDRVRSVSLAARYAETGFLGGTTSLRLGVDQGLAVLGSSAEDDLASRADADYAFAKVTADVVRGQRLFGGLTLMLAASGQYAFDSLPASEEFGVGGSSFGRGYDANRISGEHGAAATAELRTTTADPFGLAERLAPYAFFDIGWTWDEPSAATPATAATVRSAGFGLRAGFGPAFSLEVEVARTLARVDDGSGGGLENRAFLGLHSTF